MRLSAFFFALFCVFSFTGSVVVAQDHHQQRYFQPADPLVQAKLAEWQDMKFGLLVHWGPYSQWGVVESWSLCPEDEGWCVRRGPYSKDYYAYKKAYEDLQKTFNPRQFAPEKWAKAAKAAGMKYMVFTTKHHDGFCMFNAPNTPYKITNVLCPFSTHPRADVTAEVFKAFRAEGLWAGAYFSKPDWHCPDYWDPYFPPYDRNPNYNLKKYPEKWKDFQAFTYDQILTLMRDYGQVDILWLDGGWVQPMTPTSPRWGYAPVHQELNMDSLALLARQYQPGLIVVDRAVEGPNQNYLTPEQQVPDAPLPYPWETCMTMANSWSYVPGDQYKSTRTLVHNLAKIVSRGGNYLLNIAPGPDGAWDSVAYQRLSEIGQWMDINGQAIYATRPIPPFQQDKWVFTQGKDGAIYAIYLGAEGEKSPPMAFSLPRWKRPARSVELLGTPGMKYSVRQQTDGSAEVLALSKMMPPEQVAWVFKIVF